MHGNVIYDDAVIEAAQVRVDLARTFLREAGIEAVGEVGDPDPYTAAMDAILEFQPDEVVVSTLPATSSGWLRRDLVERIADASGLPSSTWWSTWRRRACRSRSRSSWPTGRPPRTRCSSTCASAPRATRQRRLHIVVIPLEGGGGAAAAQARARKAQLLDRLRSSGMLAAGVTGDPDPYTATMNALQFFRIDDIVISTLPATRSGWLRADLISRVRTASNKPVEHIAVEAPTKASAAA
jgi:hypothetical protein